MTAKLSRDAIADAATELVAEVGEAGFTMSGLSARLFTVPANLYNYTGGRDDVLDAVFQRAQAGLFDSLDGKSDDPPVEALRAGLRKVSRWATDNPNLIALIRTRTRRLDDLNDASALVGTQLGRAAESGDITSSDGFEESAGYVTAALAAQLFYLTSVDVFGDELEARLIKTLELLIGGL
ncbi:MAG: TetR/AcrR family transcriptional regulator [Actinomycetota bacterium]|nr:TetR/AcrR family transcriptional regulator [Actinomycetota bacterium]